MRKIRQKLREEMADDPFYQHCCLRHLGTCDSEGVQFHHHLQHEGKQVNEKFCILPLCPFHHEHIHLPKLKYHANKIMIDRASEEQIEKYGLQQLKDKLENKMLPWN